MTYIEAGIEVLKLIHMNGYEAYFVGGFVRDYLLGKECNDIDIATNALPNQISNIFKVVNTGIKYNCVTVLYEDYTFEVTTYRIETSYHDNRHPTYEVGKMLTDDLKRRDFTINAMAMDIDMKIIDIFDGQSDLKNKIIKTVYDPQRRFSEDALRMLRAAYFASKLNFTIERETLIAMRRCAHLIQNLSQDRICWELEKLINSKYQEVGIKYLIEANLAPYLGKFQNGVYQYQEKGLKDISWSLFIALSYYDDVEDLINIHMKTEMIIQIKTAIELAKKLSKNEFSRLELFENKTSICLLTNTLNMIIRGCKDKTNFIEEEFKKLPIYSMSDLKVNGNDILENVKISDNKMIGLILQEVKRLVLLEKIANDKESIIKYIKKHY